jgi:hypothetical protein
MSDNISFIIAIASSVGLISSEILPFIPIKGNGILHSIFFYLSKLNMKSSEKEKEKIVEKGNDKEKEKIIHEKEEKDIEKGIIHDDKDLLQKIDNSTKMNYLLMKKIKDKVDEIHSRIV